MSMRISIETEIATEGEPVENHPDYPHIVWSRTLVESLRYKTDGLGGLVVVNERPDGRLEAIFHGELRLFEVSK